jgi:hypothetical protein
MKNKILTFIMCAAVTAAALLTPQYANAYDDKTLSLSTNSVQPQAAVFDYKPIYVGGQKDVAVHLEFKLDAAGTDNQTFVFGRSISSSTNDIETLAAKRTVIAIAGTGTTKSVTVTNIPTHGAGYIWLIYRTNACATAVNTNMVIRWGNKQNAP